MVRSKDADHQITDDVCPHCGRSETLHRIDGHYIVHEIEHILHFERGILYTVRELLLRPGENIRRFLLEDRGRLVKPIIFLIITSLIYTLIEHFFHIEPYAYAAGHGPTSGLIFKWLQEHYGYANIMMAVFVVPWLKVFFRKYDYNFFELLISLCFIMGMAMLVLAVFVLLEGLTHTGKALLQTGGYASILYAAWAIGQFFNKRKVSSYLKALAAYALGSILFYVTAFSIGGSIDLILKH